jgi:hypothetical protein
LAFSLILLQTANPFQTWSLQILSTVLLSFWDEHFTYWSFVLLLCLPKYSHNFQVSDSDQFHSPLLWKTGHWLWGKVVPVLNYLSTTPWRRMGEWMYRSTFSWPEHQLEVSGQLYAPAALPPGKEPPVPIG